MAESPEEIIAAQKAQCPFCKIAAGEIPATKVYEDKLVMAVMDINPATPGHVVLFPKEHYPILPLVPPETFQHLFAVARDMSRAVKKGMVTHASSIFIANGGAAGQQTAHFLVHIFPREKGDKLQEVLKGNANEEAKQKSQQIKGALQQSLNIMLSKARFPDVGIAKPEPKHEVGPEQKKKLAEFIETNDEFRDALVKDPKEAQTIVDKNPELKELVKGVDLQKLHEKLKGVYGG